MNTSSELPEFLATVSNAADPDAALRSGVERIAETFDAEVAAVVHDNEVMASIGYPTGEDHTSDLLAAATHRSDTIEIPGMGLAEAAVVHVDEPGCAVVIARFGETLDATERAHALAMARILALALRLIKTVGSERDLRRLTERKVVENELLMCEQRTHQSILEAILRVQRLISQRHAVESILQAITDEATSLLQVDLAGIFLAGRDGPARRAIAKESPRGEELAELITADQLAEIGRLSAASELMSPGRISIAGTAAEVTVVGVPVFDDGTPIGGLYVLAADVNDERGIDTAAVQTFASQASIALTDASTLNELHHAFHDTLTGLPNRALFYDRFEHALELGFRRGTTTALLFLDLDRFKAVNDTLGHAAGDALLRDVGGRLSTGSRTYDSVARIGGDEFAILLEDTTPEDAEAAARGVLERVGQIASPAGALGQCSVSIGVALSGADCHTTDELLRRADIAMYSVKAGGRSDVAIYHPSMGRSRLDQNGMTDAMKLALVRDEFVVHYQPIVDLRTRQICGVEALVRWFDPERGLVNPADFIEVAEESGMIVPIGRRVLDTACRQVADWRQRIPSAERLHLSVNLSGRQLQHEGVRADVSAALTTSGLEPDALTLEVTESIFVNDAEAAGERLRRLKSLGVGLAVDDFGTGFSSLSYIHHYPFDVLKIDRTFVKALGTSSNGAAVVKTMLALAQQMSMTTVAEGIEKPVELAQVRALRCSHGQGFLFSRPVDADSLELLLAERARIIGHDEPSLTGATA